MPRLYSWLVGLSIRQPPTANLRLSAMPKTQDIVQKVWNLCNILKAQHAPQKSTIDKSVQA
jgi:hypothetical protein